MKPKHIKIFIGDEYGRWIDQVAQGRLDRAEEFDRPQMHNQPIEEKPQGMKVGCRAEGAVAQLYGIEYNPGPEPDEHDVGGAEVRGTHHLGGRLIGHDGKEERTKQDMIFILGLAPLEEDYVWIAGWCYGHEMFKPEKWKDHFGRGRPSFAMAQKELKDMDRLVCIDEIIQERTY